jgi:hypothetical protein
VTLSLPQSLATCGFVVGAGAGLQGLAAGVVGGGGFVGQGGNLISWCIENV